MFVPCYVRCAHHRQPVTTSLTPSRSLCLLLGLSEPFTVGAFIGEVGLMTPVSLFYVFGVFGFFSPPLPSFVFGRYFLVHHFNSLTLFSLFQKIDQCGSVVGCHTAKQKVTDSVPAWGTCLGCRFCP